MSKSSWIENHKHGIVFLVVVFVAGGVAAIFGLPVSLFPRTTFPRIVVNIDAGDRPADRMVVEVTRPVEQVIRSVPGVLDVRSTTSRGSCEIAATFGWGLDMISATLQVESAVNRTLPSLPSGVVYEVRRMDPTVFPVMGLSLTSTEHSQVELRDLATYGLKPIISTIKGVSNIKVLGGRTEEYQVLLDADRMESYKVTLSEAVNAVSEANVLQAVGRLEENEKLYLILADTQFGQLEDLNKLIIRQRPSGVVQLADIASIVKSTMPVWTRVVADGQDAVLVNIYQQPDGNTLLISKEIQRRLKDFSANMPSGIHLNTWYDQSWLISASLVSVRDAILIGIGLAVLVLLLFLRNWKVTLVACLAVPAVLAATALVMKVFHMGLNIMTLGGMAAAVGLIIDDAIVMVEHITKRMREQKQYESACVPRAAAEILPSLSGSSMASIIIFVPLAFLSGVTGAFFKALSLTMASSLVISYLFAAVAIPVIAHASLGVRDAGDRGLGKLFGAVLAVYERILRSMLRRPWLVLGAILPLLLIGFVAYRNVGSGFLPHMDEGGFILDYRAPAGTSLAETDRRLRVLEKILKDVPEVASYSRRTGLQLGGSVTEANEGDYFIRLKGMPRRHIEAVMDDVRRQVTRRVPGLEIELALLMEDLIGDLTAVPQPIEIKLFGTQGDELRTQAARLAEKIEKVPNVVDVKSGVVLAGDAWEIHVDRLKARMLGLDAGRVAHMAAVALDGVVATQVQRGEKMVGVRVWTKPEDRKRMSLIRRLRLRTSDGKSIPLGRIADFKLVTGQAQIVRENLKTMVDITARISGRDMGSVMHDVKASVAEIKLPGQMYVKYGGLYLQQQRSFMGMIAVLGAAVALLFGLFVFLYESFAAPLAILASDVLAATAVFSGLWWTGTELNISSMMGLTMVFGISSEAAIFYMTQWKESAKKYGPLDALAEAGRQRFRPILMTVLAAVLALLPLSLAIGEGASMLQPLAIAIIAGLVLTLPLSLLVLPVLFSVLNKTEKD